MIPLWQMQTQKVSYVTGCSLALELRMGADPRVVSSQNIDGLLLVCGAFDSSNSSYGR